MAPHVEFGKVPQGHHVRDGEKVSMGKFRGQVSTLLPLPAQEHHDVGKLVADRIDGRPGIAELRGGKECWVEERQPLFVMQHRHAFTTG
ncbi:hypothetical protein [Rhodanobacter terrae]|uniref:Uncharacterized protein n=1 Tax=Rhodanobacter terrae TaxID=418647 RepID=A0ABW0SZF9_9GAMM